MGVALFTKSLAGCDLVRCKLSTAGQGREGQERGGGLKEVVRGKRKLTRDTVLAISVQLLPQEVLHRATGWSSAGHCLLQSHDTNWAARGNRDAALLYGTTDLILTCTSLP